MGTTAVPDEGEALRHTIRCLHLHPDLPQLYRRSGHLLSASEAEAVSRWRDKVASIAGTKNIGKTLESALDAAQCYLDASQTALAAWWAGISWENVTAPEYYLCAAVAALSRERGPEVMLVHRLACDVIESMFGVQLDPMDITRAGQRLEHRGILKRERYGPRKTTIYQLVTKHSAAEMLSNSAAVRDARPEMAARDWAVWRVARDLLRDGAEWESGKAVAVADAGLAAREDQPVPGENLLPDDSGTVATALVDETSPDLAVLMAGEDTVIAQSDHDCEAFFDGLLYGEETVIAGGGGACRK